MDMKWDINTNTGSRWPGALIEHVDDEVVIFISSHGMTHKVPWDQITDVVVHIPEREWKITATLSGTFTMKVKARNAEEAANKAPTVGVWMFDEDGDAVPQYADLVEYEDDTFAQMSVEVAE